MKTIPLGIGVEFETARSVVYPWLCDSMGHLATQHYMKIFDDATFHILGRLGYSPREPGTPRRGWADVSHSIEYRHELLAGDLLVVFSSIQRVGNKSLTYRSRLVRPSKLDEDCATLVGVMVHFDLEARTAVELPAEIRAALQGGGLAR
jgi:acyl-CoA thioester hydrolase